ncbi:hypothetical protein C1H46_012021 [Malus baccata]|uniref:Nudix hydrolase domain-containing protein n=1 Tax=Malus baccata TaxID=106549 RepID=A0A540MUD9_MALBA|nr:hypothetical protein C1H46_012021 [Malus baccata]
MEASFCSLQLWASLARRPSAAKVSSPPLLMELPNAWGGSQRLITLVQPSNRLTASLDKDDDDTTTREAKEEIGLDPKLVNVVTVLEPFLSKVQNEYSLGQPQLYKEVNREDPKAMLDGAAIAGLVGILRQLGESSETAAYHHFQANPWKTIEEDKSSSKS